MNLNKKKYLTLGLSILVFGILMFSYIFPKEKINANSGHQKLTESEIFSNIYSANMWGGGSGDGSKPENAIAYMSMLRGVLSSNSIETIADLGCGDWQLMEKIQVPNGKIYSGFDLVQSVIDANKTKHATTNVHFFKIDNLNDFINVKADLLIVKDVIQHWPHEQVKFFLEKILPNFKYAIITNSYAKGPNVKDLRFGDFRPIDLQAPPFDKITQEINIKVFMDYPSHGHVKRVYIFENIHPYIFN